MQGTHPIVEIASDKIDLAPYAKRAIELFGGVRPEAANWLALMTAKHFNQGNLGRSIAKDGSPLTESDYAALDVPRFIKICREAAEVLERDALLDNPVTTLNLLATRIAKWAYGENRRRALMSMAPGRYYRSAEVWPMGRCCIEMRSLSRYRLPLDAAPLLPLPTCRVQRCQCVMKPSRKEPNCRVSFDDGVAQIDDL